MISRYALFEIENLRDEFLLPDGVPRGTKRHYNISPTRLANVIVTKNGKRILERMQWGFIPKNATDTRSVFRYKTYTVRSEIAFSKPTWNKAIRHERCIVPLNGFYEWHEKNNTKEAYFIRDKNHSLTAVAGVCSTWTDADGKELGTFSIVTIDSHSSSLHTKVARPIILDETGREIWLNSEITDMGTLYAAMKTYADDTLTISRVSSAINSAKINKPDLIRPIETL